MSEVGVTEPGIRTKRFLIEAPRDVQLVHALILFVLALLFLYAFRPIELSDNSLDYIDKVGRGDLFYPPHLLHSAFIKGFHSVLSSVSSCDVACAGMVHSMLWGAAAVASTYLIARTFMAAGGALLTALAVLVAHGFWVFATQLEVYVPSVGAVTTASAVLFTNRSPRLGWVRVLAVAILWAIATTYHVANVFLFLPFCAYFFGRQGWRGSLQLAIVSVLAGSLVFAAFVVAYLIDNDACSVGGFFVWVFALTNVPMTEWGSLSHWHPVWLFRAGWRQIIAVTLLPEYLTSNQTPLWIIGALVALAALAWNAFQVALPSRPAGVRVYFLLLFATNFLFFAWWQPMVHKFYIPSSVPLIFLTAMAVHDLYLRVGSTSARRVVAGLASAVVAVIFVFNLSSVLELRRSLGPYHAEAAVLDRLTPENCTIYSVGHHLNPLGVYFDRHDTVSLRSFLTAFHHFATGEPPAERIAFEQEECALMPLGFLSKAYYDRYVGAYIGESRWPEYVGFFFDLQPDPETGGVTYNPFELVAEGDGPPLVLVDRRRRVAAGSIEELAETIGAEVDRAMQKYAADWPRDTEPNLAVVPLANVEIGRYRRDIFGYAFGESGRPLGPQDD